ncbi:interleukin-21 receptor [Xenopus laevis]|uniref:Interleukin-21 receptor n=2 Tax=Xenopus laevis TaxID=8355 RepID=A0A1L8EXT7_XENLA|nr:interleukin-21 receptor [Xenopus laevis]XP_041432913.1 interleukin-21 receptor [Xenopus laevis]XP_041432914.1 interleukin-21 receptor [Xenopus laevis]OCT64152.1 hypothetical protein XELAEV_18045253mg [Xenopus laevis]
MALKMSKIIDYPCPASLLLLCFLVSLAQGCEDLHCYVDYIDTLTCKYEKTQKEASYSLSAMWTNEDLENTFCDLVQTDEFMYICNEDMEYFGADDIYTIFINGTINGQMNTSQTCGPFYLSKTFVPRAPYNLTVLFSENYNFSWETTYKWEVHLQANELAYELSYKRTDESWKKQKCIHILEDEKNVVLLQSSFQNPGGYIARVRAKPKNSSIYQGDWSEWSNSVQWTTNENISGNIWIFTKSTASVLCLVCGIVIIIILSCKPIELPQRLWKNVWVLVPDPGLFFKPLYMRHGGDFKSWLGYPYVTISLPIDVSVAPSEVLEIYSRNVLKHATKPGLDNSDVNEKLLSSNASCGTRSQGCRLCNCSAGTNDTSFQSISIETVTVSDGATPCCSKCNDVNGLFDNGRIADGETSGDDGYPTLNIDSGGSNLLDHFPENGPQSEASSNHTLEHSFDIPENTARPNLFDVISIPPEEWKMQASPSQDDESVFYSDEHYDSLSPSSGSSEDFGYPRMCLDMDTIDSGFVDSECGSPVESDFGKSKNSPKMQNLEPYSGHEEEWQTNYVKQWVP